MGNSAGNNAENVAYLFATNPGISKVGKYETLSNGDPQNIDCGFTTGVRAVIIKRMTNIPANDPSVGGWFCFDQERGIANITSENGAVNFDGSVNSYLKISNPGTAFHFGGQDPWTIEFWIKTTDSTGWIMYNASSNTGMRICLGNNASNNHAGYLEWNEQVSNGDSYYRSTTRVDDGQWHHIAICKQHSANTKLYVDGTFEVQGDHSRNWGNHNNDVYFGRRQEGSGAIDADISNFRITASCLYTGNFTPSTSPLGQTADTKLLFMQSAIDRLEAAVTPNTVEAGSTTWPQASGENPFGQTTSPYMRLDNTSAQTSPTDPWIKRIDQGFRIESGNNINTANETYIYYAIA